MNLSCIIVSVSYKKGEMNMKQLANVNTQEIAEVEFVFENCECCTVPIECFKELSIKVLEEEYDDELGKEYQICEVNFHVVDNCQIEMELYDTQSFAQRVAQHHDIAQIIIKHTDGSQSDILPVWYDDEERPYWESNQYQQTELISYKEVKISIANSNKTYTLEEVLKSGHGSRFMLNNVVYEVKNGVLWGDTYENGEIYKVVTVGLDNLDIIKGQFTKID